MFIGNANISGRRTDGSIVYLLDTYSAAAAYSLRQLRTGVTNVARIRRSSDNAESDFTATEILDGTLLSFAGSSSAYVTIWYDQSGNGNDVSQASAAAQPRIVSSGVIQGFTTGTAGMSWGYGGVQRLFTSALTELNHGNDFSIIAAHLTRSGFTETIVSTSNTTAVSRFVHVGASNAGGLIGHVHNGTNLYWAQIGSSVGTTNSITTTIVDGTSKTIDAYHNGNGAYSVTWTGSYNNATFSVGLDRDNDWETGVISEVIVFGSKQTANRTAIESDINTHYSIY